MQENIENQVEQETLPKPATFKELFDNSVILDAVAKLGFISPTAVQEQAIPVLLKGSDAIVQARTGSGKTLAFTLPLLAQMAKVNPPKNQTFALVVAPTRELAYQVREVVASVTTEIRPACLIGGADAEKQSAELTEDARIVVGTPGRILDFLRSRKLRLKNCRYFVLDEADEMLSTGFLEDIRAILSQIPEQSQGLFVSATITPRVDMLSNSFLVSPEIIRVDASPSDMPSISHYYCDVGGDLMSKPNALCDIIETYRPKSAIIFCNTKSDTQLVEVLLRRRGFDARRLNSDLSQSKRDKVMKKIRDGELQFLVATDIAARGIDIEELEMVINYAVHDQAEIYIHRTGRTGRAGKTGKTISLVGPKDFGAFHHLKKVIDVEFQKLPLPTDDVVADARLAHLYEIIRRSKIEPTVRDTLVTQKLIKEMTGTNDYPEEFELMLTKICRAVIEHYVNEESKSLDEELEGGQLPREDGESSEEGERESSGRERGREHRRERGDRREGRGDRDDRRDRREGRGDRDDRRDRRDRRDDRRADRRDENELPTESANTAAPTAEVESQARHQPRERSEQQRKPQDSLVRLYIGQGFVQGMTGELFRELAQEFAEIDPQRLKQMSIREHYGFVDVSAASAKSLIDSLNGIEYNGFPLPVEVATVFPIEERRDRRDNRRGGRGGYNNRRGGGGRDNYSRRDSNRRGYNNRGY